ncbi:unnamed protein product [Urochloa humidicola]
MEGEWTRSDSKSLRDAGARSPPVFLGAVPPVHNHVYRQCFILKEADYYNLEIIVIEEVHQYDMAGHVAIATYKRYCDRGGEPI